MRSLMLSALFCAGCFDVASLSTETREPSPDMARSADGGVTLDFSRVQDDAAADLATEKVTQVNLSSAFNIAGIYFDGSTFAANAGLDGAGNAASSSLLAGAPTWMGTTIAGIANASNTVQTTGQVLPLPIGRFSSLRVVADSAYTAPTVTFVVNYNDATTATFTQSISDFITPQDYPGEAQAVTVAYYLHYDGTEINKAFHAYGYEFALDTTKTVASVTLPNSSTIRVFAMSLIQ